MIKVYESVEDIDLFAGLTLEKKFDDALIGETFICLIADVFARLRFGDRFFYDLEGKEKMTSIRELNEINLKFGKTCTLFYFSSCYLPTANAELPM